MSNNAHVNDDEIEIHQLPEVTALQSGMMVAVDSEPTGTKCFNLTTALEGKASASDFTALENTVAAKANASDMTTALDGKVDTPATTPAEGQVLTFNGSANTWANPPEGVYMLKYSEVTNLDDVDLDKATTIPTFILIDSNQTLVIGNGSSGTTITVNAGTIMRLEEVGVPDDAGKPKLLTFVNDYGKSATGGTYMTYGNYFVRLVVSKSTYGGVSKQFGVSADIWDSNLFRSQQLPVVKKYDTARGPAESSGNLNGDANSLIVSFEDAGSNKRRQLLPPAELASHDFSSDTTPEQIQFMGWGATSNRAGYKTINEVPASTSSNAGQVLTVNNSGTPAWQALQPGDTNLLVDVARPLDSTKAITATKTYTEIKQAVDSGKHVILRVQEGATPGYLDAWTEYYTIQSYADDSGTIRFLEDAIFPSVSSSDNRYNTVETRNNFRMLAIFSDNTWKSYSINPSSGIRTDTPKTVSTSTVDVKNNMITPISTSQSTLTVNCIYDNEDAPNFVVEITPTNNLVLTVTASDRWNTQTTTLKSSVAAGNALTAGKTYQVTAVGNCWTLAEFEA